MATLSEAEAERLREAVLARLEADRSSLRPSEFLDNLIDKTIGRYPPLLNAAEPTPDGPSPAEPAEPEGLALADLEGGLPAAVAFCVRELLGAAASPYFALVEQVAVSGDDQAVTQLMGMLDRALKLRGILFRYRMDPDDEYPAIWGKVWEAIPKWDGRDFRAYVARIVRNHCLDEIARRKRRPGSMEEEPRDPRPRGQTADRASARDAMSFVLAVLDELEASGRIKALDGVIFSLISHGRAVADIVEGFRTSGVPARLGAAVELCGGTLGSKDAFVLQQLLGGLTPDEVAGLTGRDEADVSAVATALLGAEHEPLAEEDALVAKAFAREGIASGDLDRAQRLTTNAVNLCINRIRLKVWMALVDRAYEALRRRGAIDAVDLAIVQHRCTHAPHAGCRMYKDRTCKREASTADIARRGGLDLSPDAVGRRMDDLREKLIEQGLGLVFPDYNACLIERKPERRRSDG